MVRVKELAVDTSDFADHITIHDVIDTLLRRMDEDKELVIQKIIAAESTLCDDQG